MDGFQIEMLDQEKRPPVYNRLAEKEYGKCVVCGVKLNQYSYTDRCFHHHADYVISMAAQGKEVREERRVLHQRPDRIGREERRKYYARFREEKCVNSLV